MELASSAAVADGSATTQKMPRQQNRAARRMRRPGLFGKRSAGAIWAGAACWLLFSCGTQSADGELATMTAHPVCGHPVCGYAKTKHVQLAGELQSI